MICCPSDEHLARLLEESLDRDELTNIEKHLEACTPCQEALEELTRERFSYSSTWRPWAEQPPGEAPGSSSLSSFDGLGSAFDRDYRRPSSLIGHPPTLPSADVTGDDWPDVEGYQILGRLGHGGMGVVYRAKQRGLDRLVALKMIRAGSHAGPEQFTRFRIEVRSVARLRHPNVVQVYDVGEADGLPFVTLELLEGGSLEARVAGNPQPERASAELVATLARAVAAAHRAGVVHRDLKPANVLFAADGTPKITDFGLAKRLDEEDGQTHSGQVMGSPSFMAPEQARGQGRVVGPAADIYSLGAILYEMLTGRPPFKGASPMETLFQVVHDEPAPPSKLRSALSRDLETICLKCLAKEPGRRYLDADALADDLARLLAGSPILGRRVGAGERLVRWARRQPASAALAALGLVGVVASAFTFFQGQQNVAHLRIEGSGVLAEGRVALGGKHWQNGKAAIEPFLAKIRTEPSLADLRENAENLLQRINDGKDIQDREEDARKRLDAFLGLRRKALIRDAQSAGAVLPVNIRATRDAARAALAVFPTSDPLPESIGPGDRATIDRGRSELLLILAELVARPLDGEKVRTQAEEALRLLDQAGKLRPPTRASHLLRASCLASFGDEAGAGIERASAEESAATDALGHVLKGQELSRRQRWIAAIAEFEDALRLEPQQFRAQLLLAVCKLHAGKYAEARAGLTACLQAEPDAPSLYRMRGFAQGEEAYARQKQTRNSNPTTPDPEGPFEAAEADFRKGLSLVGTEDDERYNLLVGRGILRVRSHRLEEAVQDLQAAVDLRPESALAMIPLGQAYQKQGRIDEAIEQFTLGLKLKPDLAALYRSRALVRLDRGKPSAEAIDQAMSDLSQAIKLEAPASIEGANDRARRARLLSVLGRFDEALVDCDAALKVAPDNADALLIRVKSLLELKRYEDVVAACDASIGRGRASAELFDLRGLARAKRDDYSGAIQDYTQALGLDPVRASSLVHRGWAYVVSEAPKLALRDFDEAIKLTPDDPEAYNGRGFAYVVLGQVRLGVADAVQSLRRGGGGEPDARTTYNAARIYAKAAAVVHAGAATDNPRRSLGQDRIADEYQDQAQSLIRLALERLPQARRAEFWRDVVQGDPALAAIRQRPKFSQLAGQFGRQAQ